MSKILARGSVTITSTSQGLGVKTIDVEFAIGTSPTEAPISGWQTIAPTWESGEYIWQRLKTIFTDDTSTYSSPINITVSGGGEGRGVNSITEEYAISSTKTQAPTSGWSENQPEWEYGKYLWFRTIANYTDSTSMVIGTWFDASWDMLTHEEINTENLFLDTRHPSDSSIWSAGMGYPYDDTTIGDFSARLIASGWGRLWQLRDWEPGYYTVSAWVKRADEFETAGYPTKISAYLPSKYGYTLFKSLGGNTLSASSSVSDLSNEYQLFVWTLDLRVKPTADLGSDYRYPFRIEFYVDEHEVANPKGVIYGLKVQKGTKYTGYSENIEDVRGEVSDIKNQIDNLDTYINGALSDNLIDESEKQAIKALQTSIDTEMLQLSSIYNQLSNNSYLTGSAESGLVTAYNNLTVNESALDTAINNLVNASSITDVLRNAYNTALNNYNTSITNYTTAVEVANKAIQDRIKQLNEGYTDDAIEQIQPIYKRIDATSLDINKFYPVIIKSISTYERTTCLVKTELTSAYGSPSWSRHGSTGFVATAEWSVYGEGYGTRKAERIIKSYELAWVTVDSVIGSIGQLSRSSTEYIYVRGGAKYDIAAFTNYGNIDDNRIELITESYTIQEQSVTVLDEVVIPTTQTFDISNANSIAQDAAEDAQIYIDTLSDYDNDLRITPTEKVDYRSKWKTIESEHPKYLEYAESVGYDSSSYLIVYNNLNNYLNGSTGILVDMNITSTVSEANAVDKVFTVYYEALLTMTNDIAALVRTGDVRNLLYPGTLDVNNYVVRHYFTKPELIVGGTVFTICVFIDNPSDSFTLKVALAVGGSPWANLTKLEDGRYVGKWTVPNGANPDAGLQVFSSSFSDLEDKWRGSMMVTAIEPPLYYTDPPEVLESELDKLDYLKDALLGKDTTTVDGLVLANVLGVSDDITKGTSSIRAGLSGIEGDGIAFFGHTSDAYNYSRDFLGGSGAYPNFLVDDSGYMYCNSFQSSTVLVNKLGLFQTLASDIGYGPGTSANIITSELCPEDLSLFYSENAQSRVVAFTSGYSTRFSNGTINSVLGEFTCGVPRDVGINIETSDYADQLYIDVYAKKFITLGVSQVPYYTLVHRQPVIKNEEGLQLFQVLHTDNENRRAYRVNISGTIKKDQPSNSIAFSIPPTSEKFNLSILKGNFIFQDAQVQVSGYFNTLEEPGPFIRYNAIKDGKTYNNLSYSTATSYVNYLPNNLIEQWGQVWISSGTTATRTITFSRAYNSTNYVLTLTPDGTLSLNSVISVNRTTSGLSIMISNSGSGNLMWRVIGEVSS